MKKDQVKTVIHIFQAHMKDNSTKYYWVKAPNGMNEQQALKTQKAHGPFSTPELAEKNAEAALFGRTTVVWSH